MAGYAYARIISGYLPLASIGLISFCAVLVEFILTALVLFLIIKAMNKAKSLKKKPEAKPAAPTTKVCPFCQSEISIKATRCPHCTSELK